MRGKGPWKFKLDNNKANRVRAFIQMSGTNLIMTAFKSSAWFYFNLALLLFYALNFDLAFYACEIVWDPNFRYAKRVDWKSQIFTQFRK